MMYNVCNRHPLVCVSRLMVALQLYIIQQRVSLVCAKFRICSFIVGYVYYATEYSLKLHLRKHLTQLHFHLQNKTLRFRSS